jgi:hypothetical protein
MNSDHYKGKVHPRTGNKGPEGQQRYSSSLSLILALDGGEWSIPCPCHFTPGKDLVPTVQQAGWAKGLVWKGNLAPTVIRSPDRPARSAVTILIGLSQPTR